MHLDYHIWLNNEDKRWRIDQEVWRGNSWGTDYCFIAGPFDTKEEAQRWLKAMQSAHIRWEESRIQK